MRVHKSNIQTSPFAAISYLRLLSVCVDGSFISIDSISAFVDICKEKNDIVMQPFSGGDLQVVCAILTSKLLLIFHITVLNSVRSPCLILIV